MYTKNYFAPATFTILFGCNMQLNASTSDVVIVVVVEVLSSASVVVVPGRVLS